ncbi:hypothetical protein [Bradyrhizobium sp. STM 3809]|uniref:hypothetical protein n=1 Tax=Bradyrhizobium sp. STM 3809 TaxID=551936 RepID=UPI0002409929|nr:hypothetical protein [Bradyrhizobium sp. STM 3809]CCE02432.1 conserved exported hypothetical protein [Bradyrhizobium sp. STM 3809]
MKRISLLCATAAIAAAALTAASPAGASPYHLIRWNDTGFCQVWDNGVPTRPWPANYQSISTSVPSLIEVLAMKEHLLRHGHCRF